MEAKRYRPSQAAKILNVSTWTMQRWIREGRVPAIKSETGRYYIPSWWINGQIGERSKSEEGSNASNEE